MTERDFGLSKRATGIPGLDAATGGGLPSAGGVLVLGGPGSGKTLLGLQIVARATEQGDGGVFVSFEETVPQIQRDASSFTWGPALIASDRWRVIDGRPPRDAAAAGGFDLQGLLAAAGTTLDQVGGSWLILDGIDQLLRLEPESSAAANEVGRLNDWCEARGVTLLLTGKTDQPHQGHPAYLEGVEYMLSTVLTIETELVGRRLNRRFRIAKYRGTAHITDELPLVIDDDGLHLPYFNLLRPTRPAPASSERLGTGVPRLDEVLGGGVYRGSTTLISGAPGTAKTTFAVCMARGAAERGETALYLSFDELADRLVRNAASVGLTLDHHIDSGLFHIESREAWNALMEQHFIAIQRSIERIQPEWLIIDPISALLKATSAEGAFVTTERILSIARERGITAVLTSLVESDGSQAESTLSHTSTLADNWISLDYRILGGERNRALSVVKARGSAHSNQVREVVLSSAGVDLAEPYEYGSTVLMGTARIQKEHEEATTRRREAHERAQRQRDLERHIEQARMRMEESQSEVERLQEELERERRDTAETEDEAQEQRQSVRRQRTPGATTVRPVDDNGEGE